MHVRLAAIDVAEMRELVLDAWQIVVPKRVAVAYDEGNSQLTVTNGSGSEQPAAR